MEEAGLPRRPQMITGPGEQIGDYLARSRAAADHRHR
jgi:hypothetical protein